YTPSAIATYLASWAIRSPIDRVLEPSAGDGAFVVAVADRLRGLDHSDLSLELVAVERHPAEASKIRSLAPQAVVITSDFFDVTPQFGQQFDAVIGNPPFIRFHGFTGSDRVKALGRARAQGADLSELASSWAHFVAHSIGFLKPEGRLALVLPAELLHADYAHPIRQLLSRRFRSLTVIAFDRQVFPDAQVDAVLLLAAPEGEPGYRILRTRDAATLRTLDIPIHGGSALTRMPQDQPSRWSAALQPAAAAVYETIATSPRFVRLGSRATVDIGFVSGSDDYFVPSRERADELGLPPEVLLPAIRRPGDVRGLVARPHDAAVLFRPVGTDASQLPAVAAYIEHGQLPGVPARYKCQVRQDWFIVPLPRAQPDAFMPYMNHRAPRLIVNRQGHGAPTFCTGSDYELRAMTSACWLQP
ncbi:MAG: N-6 DNA methylase, partial [Chloroflexi bacterium]|nr:N-6 DNA methylase [Chloroflexota bacterium]